MVFPTTKSEPSHSHRRIQPERECLLYVGTYTGGSSEGIYAFRFSAEHGTLAPVGLVAKTVNPSFLAVHPSNRLLYAVGEVRQYEGTPSGLVSAFSINSESGALTLLGEVASRGALPCHVAVDWAGRFAIVTNYLGGSVTVFRILDDGKLGEMTAFVQHSDGGPDQPGPGGPRAHGAFFSPDNRFVLVPDLGLDRLFIYSLDKNTGRLESVNPPYVNVSPGAGPRHFAFHPSGCHGYAINERDSTVAAFCCERATCRLEPFQTISTLPPEYSGDNATAEIEIDANGRFLYASNRGADNIAVFAIGSQAALRLVEHVPTQGRTPRHFAIDPSGSYLVVANQDSDNVLLFRRNTCTGRLTSTGEQHQVGAPACLVFVPCQ